MNPFGIECLNYSSFNVTRYMEISMYPFGQEFFNWYQCHKVLGNFHGPFRYRIFELATMVWATYTTWKFHVPFWTRIFELILMLQGTWKFQWNLSV